MWPFIENRLGEPAVETNKLPSVQLYSSIRALWKSSVRFFVKAGRREFITEPTSRHQQPITAVVTEKMT